MQIEFLGTALSGLFLVSLQAAPGSAVGDGTKCGQQTERTNCLA